MFCILSNTSSDILNVTQPTPVYSEL